MSTIIKTIVAYLFILVIALIVLSGLEVAAIHYVVLSLQQASDIAGYTDPILFLLLVGLAWDEIVHPC